MATMYDDLDDAELDAKIATYRAARESIILGGDGGVGTVKSVADGDRRIEYTAANLGALETELKALLAEKNRRTDPYGRGSGRAIEVEFD